MGTPHMNLTPLASPGQLAAEHAVYADFMRTVLEVINTIITTGQAASPATVIVLASIANVLQEHWCVTAVGY